jgi:hypothetical protein
MPRITSNRTAQPLGAEELRTIRTLTEHYFTRRGQLVGGPANAVYAVGGSDLFDWLSRQTPEGATISETMAAIVLDVMHEETDDEH